MPSPGTHNNFHCLEYYDFPHLYSNVPRGASVFDGVTAKGEIEVAFKRLIDEVVLARSLFSQLGHFIQRIHSGQLKSCRTFAHMTICEELYKRVYFSARMSKIHSRRPSFFVDGSYFCTMN